MKNKSNGSNHFFRLLIIFILTISAVLSSGFLTINAKSETLKIYDSTAEFRHFDFETDENNLLESYDEKKIVTSIFNTKVIENPYIKVTLLPEYGGRILSIIYKPTGRELLYQNPIGTPYGINEGNFYYNWLMIYGGIFPTFPEPEHGKTWCLPWETIITEQSEEKISVEMRFTDNISPVAGIPGQFDNGNTGITCISTVTVYKDTSFVDFNVQLINNRNEPVNYEYWTCITLAPGSEPGNTACPPNTEMVVPINQVLLRDNWWAWMGEAEKPINKGKHIFEYKNLALFINWADMGIAYANPSVEKDWWGVINHENEEGILRIANNKLDTPGLKFWTWGIKSHDTDIETFGDSSRPYIELWGGHSSEFFADTTLKANELKSWDEYYIPTVGLSKITSANKHASAYLSYAEDIKENKIKFSADVFSTHPDKSLKVSLKLKGEREILLLEDTIVSDAKSSNNVGVSFSKDSIEAGDYSYTLELKDMSGEILADISIPFSYEQIKPAGATETNQPASLLSAGFWIIAAGALLLAAIFIGYRILKHISLAKN